MMLAVRLASALLLGLSLAAAPALAQDVDATKSAPALPPDAGVLAPGAKRHGRDVKTLTLLYFHASWCQSCKRFDAGGALDAVKQAEPDLAVRTVDVDTEVPTLEKYGVEVTPTLVLVDADGYQLARPRIDLDDGKGTAERILKAVRKSTGRK
ncbi:MAG: thioredoxin family protein [Myxococcota bacterium]